MTAERLLAPSDMFLPLFGGALLARLRIAALQSLLGELPGAGPLATGSEIAAFSDRWIEEASRAGRQAVGATPWSGPSA